jgi:hypothetical protein
MDVEFDSNIFRSHNSQTHNISAQNSIENNVNFMYMSCVFSILILTF